MQWGPREYGANEYAKNICFVDNLSTKQARNFFGPDNYPATFRPVKACQKLTIQVWSNALRQLYLIQGSQKSWEISQKISAALVEFTY